MKKLFFIAMLAVVLIIGCKETTKCGPEGCCVCGCITGKDCTCANCKNCEHCTTHKALSGS